MEKIKITWQEVFEWQENTWSTYCSQDRVALQCNLLGQWRVIKGLELVSTHYDALAFDKAKESYIQTLEAIVPHWKIAVEFIQMKL